MSERQQVPQPSPLPEGGSLLAWQQAVRRVCLEPKPPLEALRALGGSERWLVYRNLVRRRLCRMVAQGWPRTCRALGPQRFEAWAARWLHEAPPRSRYIRDVVVEMADYCLPRWRQGEAPHVPAWVADLAEYETAVWAVRWALDPPEAPTEPFDFRRPVRLAPAHAVLQLGYAVHRWRPTASGSCAAQPPPAQEPTRLLVFREPRRFRVQTWELRPFGAALLQWWRAHPEQPAIEGVRGAARQVRVPIDAALLDRLGDLVARLIAAGVVLCRPPPQPPARS